MKTFKEYALGEKVEAKFEIGDVIVNHLGEKKFDKIKIKDIKGDEYITSRGKIAFKFQDSYKLAP